MQRKSSTLLKLPFLLVSKTKQSTNYQRITIDFLTINHPVNNLFFTFRDA